MPGETPPPSLADYGAFGHYYSLFQRWGEASDDTFRRELQGEMADLDKAVGPVARAEANEDTFAEAYLIGHALTDALAGWAPASNRPETMPSELDFGPQREASEELPRRVSALLEDAAREVIPVGDKRGFDRNILSFLPQFAPRHVETVAQRVPGMRKLLGEDPLDLDTALVLTVTHHTPDLLEGSVRKRIRQLTSRWRESDEGKTVIGEVLGDENKMRTNGNLEISNKRRTVVTTRMPRRKVV
jgi:hypothetical protein